MKIRNLALASVVLLALIGTLYWSEHKRPSDDAEKTSTPTAPPILKLDGSTITKLELKRKDAAPLVLAKNASGAWQIIEPKLISADQSAVSGTVSALSSLSSERLIDEKVRDLKQYGLEPPAVEVDITEKDNQWQKLLLGDDTPTGNAVYAKVAGDPRVFTVASYIKSSIDKTLNDVREKRLLTVSADKVSRLDLTRKSQTIEFGRDKDDWHIIKPQPLRADSMQVEELLNKLVNARMDLSGSEKDAALAFGRATPVAVARITDQSGSQELHIRKAKDKDDYYAKSSLDDDVYKIDSSLGKAVDKGLDDFRNRKLFDFGFSELNKIEIRNESTAYILTKSGEDWWSNGKKMDSNEVESCVSSLRDFSASKFAQSGFANPTIQITVISDGGKRAEKVSIGKSGANYIAKRENDPTLYQMDSSSVEALLKSAEDIKSAANHS